MIFVRLANSSKEVARALVIALAAASLGTGVVVLGSATPANASTCSTTATGYAGGDGSSGDPYQISSAAQLIRLATTTADWSGNNFIQTNDIDLAGCEWPGIGSSTQVFTGTYDGGFHTVSGFSMTTSTAGDVGFFGRISQTTIRKLTLEGSITSGRDYIGGVVGFIPDVQVSTVTQVHSKVDIAYSGGNYAGGIVGNLGSSSVVSFSTHSGQLSSSQSFGSIGGITGFGAGTIESSYSRATFSGASSYKSGLNGWGNPTIRRSYSVGPGANGGIAGSSLGGSSRDLFWDTTVGPAAAKRDGTSLSSATGITTSQMNDITTFSSTNYRIVDGWDTFDLASWSNYSNLAPANAKIWGMCSQVNDGYPFLLWEYTTDVCYVAPPAPSSSGPSITLPTAEVSGISIFSGPGNSSVVRIELTKTPAAFDSLYVVVRLLDFSGRLLEELRVPVLGNSSALEVPIERNMGDFNVVALTSNAAGATTAVNLKPQTVKQSNIRKATQTARKRLTGKSLNRDVLFTADSATITPQMKRNLRQAARLAKASDSRVAVTGFSAASPKGTKFEKRLAETRALRVANFLRKQGLENWIYFHGLNSVKGSDFAGQSRRVEIRVLK